MVLIQVCDRCLTASCWHGEFMCDEFQQAGTRYMEVTELRILDREHPDFWKTDEELASNGHEARPIQQ